MGRVLPDDIVCPLCRGDLANGSASELTCATCGAVWPVRNGIARLVPPDLVPKQASTATAFGWQWQHFSEMHPEFEAQFLDWITPLDAKSFHGKRVLDAGCGTGRHAYFAAKYCATEVVALDLSDAVETARATLAEFDNVHVVQGDLLRPPFESAHDGAGFDLVYSIGVLHHLPDPRAGLESLARLVRPGGTLAVWVYGYEGNGFVRNVVEPLRKLSTRIPARFLRALAWPLAIPFHGLARGVYRPLSGTRVGDSLPLSDYMTSVAGFTFRQNYGIVFDQLAAPSTVYVRGVDLSDWLRNAGLDEVSVVQRHGNSWRGQGTVTAA